MTEISIFPLATLQLKTECCFQMHCRCQNGKTFFSEREQGRYIYIYSLYLNKTVCVVSQIITLLTVLAMSKCLLSTSPCMRF